jgi:undecaprenyl-diphosphatase
MSTAENGHLFFDVLLHFGTLISICVVYWHDIVDMVNQLLVLVHGARSRRATETGSLPAARLFLMIVIGTLPLIFVLPINDYVGQLYYHTLFIGAMLILTGCLLYVADKMMPGKRNQKTMRIRDALIVGLCQAVATIPGISRSGATITAGVATGLDRDYAVKYSFLLSLPAVLGANILTLPML